MKKIKDLNLDSKKVIIRVDFNVPIKDGKIVDDNKILESLETINYCLERNAKVILLSHLGRVEKEEDKAKNSLEPVAIRLSEVLNKKVLFVNTCMGTEVDMAVNNMEDGDIILLENTRYLDIEGKLESKNNPELGIYWASLADIFINDAFGTVHRAHASNVGIATHIKESAIGFLIEKELDNILPAINQPERPFIVILGGAKVSTKIDVTLSLIDKADYILIGGAMAYTFLKAKGMNIGKSLIDEDSLNFCKEMLDKSDKIILPIDHVCSTEINENNESYIKEIMDNDDIALDIGPKTIELFTSYINKSKTIIWNGPMGYYEINKYQTGTKELCHAISKLNITSIAGGGDTVTCVINMGYKDKFTHISTGGGATIELIEGKYLPGISCIK